MAIVGKILSKVVDLKKSLPEIKLMRNAARVQKNQLLKLLRKSRATSFGKKYQFDDIFFSKDPVKTFQRFVPIHDYDKMFSDWWHKCLNEEEDVCWPGKVKYFALSSGTSGAPSKHIPLTSEMIKGIKRTSIKQLLTLSKYDLPEGALNKGFLMIGGSTHLVQFGNYYKGDLSGITASKIPSWFQYFYKPGNEIAKERDWETKIQMIVENANSWDIGAVVGVPAWIQIIIERIIRFYNLKNIHEIWPNLAIFVHGGVSFVPYKKSFEKLLGKPLIYIENYLASEGFIAYQSRPGTNGMKLNLNGGIFFEFVPFNEDNFDSEGAIKNNAQAFTLNEIEKNIEYAILLSTNAGAWRYLIGDTVKFTDLENHELIITGRTKHFLSLVGEHLSVDNMNSAIAKVSDVLNVEIPEYTVSAVQKENLFAHHWYLGVKGIISDTTKVAEIIDNHLKEINDDYAVERKSALKDLELTILSAEVFLKWMEKNGKVGGQNKFPRVLNKSQHSEWKEFIADKN